MPGAKSLQGVKLGRSLIAVADWILEKQSLALEGLEASANALPRLLSEES